MISLWLAVTNDKYELPLVVEESARLLGLKLGISKHAVSMAQYNEERRDKKRAAGNYKYNSKIRSERKIIRIEVESLDDDE